ncbi:hypothetical protein HPB50_019402 [Hyalomma asiaticum]|uniref:Uncharacterized protein n=1 Tax=Hyalomma asiaticum TaxID=266040 RepID=A0ACB7SAJ6_HYAAI|nr:hypothetical protein HPB50_019402 [Hyalomma asiaticum]
MLHRLLSLRSLTFDLLRFAPEDQRAFLKALARNEFLQEVRVVPQNQGYPTTLSRIATETGTATRIHTSRIFMEEMNIEQLERGLHVDEVIFEVNSAFSNTEMLTMKVCYDVPGTLHNITTMNILITGCIIDVNVAKELALCLQRTKYLEVLTLDLSANKEACMHLIEAISSNTSITTLGVERWCHSRSNAVVLADIVSSSKNIHTLTYHRESMVPSRAFFARLSDSIESNFTLARVSTFERKEDAKKWAIIQNVAIRNSTLVERAARFVANLSFAKIDAEAFELVASSPLLRSQVQTLAAVEKCEAPKMIRQTIWNLRDMDVFMSVTGVVRESVVCEGNRDGRPRLDTLPPECWHAIRRYLSVVDVVSNAPNGR